MEENKIIAMKADQQNSMLFKDACTIIEQVQSEAYRLVNETLIKRNWLLGVRVHHEVLKEQRAEYGEQTVKNLAKELTDKYGSGYSRNNLYRFISFYKIFPNMFQSTYGEFEIVPSMTGQSQKIPSLMGLLEHTDFFDSMKPTKPLRLSWTHYSIILQENTDRGRAWYEQEAAREMWSTRTLQRNVSSQYYHRLLHSHNQEAVHNEMQTLTAPLQDKLEYLKNPLPPRLMSGEIKVNEII